MPRACQVLAAQPFSVMLGAKLLALDLGHAEVAVPKGANVRQRNGIAQGDLIAFLADAAVNYMRAAHDQELVARADVLHRGSLLAATCSTARSTRRSAVRRLKGR